jgi:hypothetical protein
MKVDGSAASTVSLDARCSSSASTMRLSRRESRSSPPGLTESLPPRGWEVTTITRMPHYPSSRREPARRRTRNGTVNRRHLPWNVNLAARVRRGAAERPSRRRGAPTQPVRIGSEHAAAVEAHVVLPRRSADRGRRRARRRSRPRDRMRRRLDPRLFEDPVTDADIDGFVGDWPARTLDQSEFANCLVLLTRRSDVDGAKSAQWAHGPVRRLVWEAERSTFGQCAIYDYLSPDKCRTSWAHVGAPVPVKAPSSARLATRMRP